MIVGISGYVQDGAGNIGSAAAGKSAVSNRLVAHHNCTEIAFADEIKRLCCRYWGFRSEQLWGAEKDTPVDGRAPRYYFQQVGTSLRHLDPDIWVRLTLHAADTVLHGSGYTKERGVFNLMGVGVVAGVVIPDVRFPNEAQAIRNTGGVVWRKKRTVERLAVGPHISEIGLVGWADKEFDAVLEDTSSLDILNVAVDAAFRSAVARKRGSYGRT